MGFYLKARVFDENTGVGKNVKPDVYEMFPLNTTLLEEAQNTIFILNKHASFFIQKEEYFIFSYIEI